MRGGQRQNQPGQIAEDFFLRCDPAVLNQRVGILFQFDIGNGQKAVEAHLPVKVALKRMQQRPIEYPVTTLNLCLSGDGLQWMQSLIRALKQIKRHSRPQVCGQILNMNLQPVLGSAQKSISDADLHRVFKLTNIPREMCGFQRMIGQIADQD